MVQVNIIIRTDSDNDIKSTLAMLRTMWNYHYEKSQGQLIYGFVKSDPNWSKNILKEQQDENTIMQTLKDFAERFDKLERIVVFERANHTTTLETLLDRFATILGIPDESELGA